MNGELFRAASAAGRGEPGHDIECSWFVEGRPTERAALHKKARNVFNFAIEAGWDKGIRRPAFFIDCKGLPPEAYGRHDMKL